MNDKSLKEGTVSVEAEKSALRYWTEHYDGLPQGCINDLRAVRAAMERLELRLSEAENVFRKQVAAIDSWSLTTTPGRAHEVLVEVGQLARDALQTKE